MAGAKPKWDTEPPPSADGVTTAMSVAVEAIRVAQGEAAAHSKAIKKQCSQIEDDRRRYVADRAEFDTLRDEVESKLADLAESTKNLDKQAADNDARQTEVAKIEKRLSELGKTLDAREGEMADGLLKQQESANQLVMKTETLARSRQQCDDERKALESKHEETRSQAEKLEQRSEQLDTYAGELSGSRDALKAMQGQLVRDQKEIGTQREALLSKIGGAIQAPGASEATEEKTEALSQKADAPNTRGPGPKSGGGSSAEQFRKLRRDAKRKSIGL